MVHGSALNRGTPETPGVMVRKILLVVIVIEALTFLTAALLHSGIEIPLIHEPKIIPAMIVEGSCGIFLAISAYAIGMHKKRAWKTAIYADIFSIAGVLLGIIALALGRGPTTELNYIYHRTILSVLMIMLIILFTSRVKSELNQPQGR